MAEHAGGSGTGRRKLPPISPRADLNNTNNVNETTTKRKKKRKPAQDNEGYDSGVDGTPKERRRSGSRQRESSRSRQGVDETSENTTSGRKPRSSPRPRKSSESHAEEGVTQNGTPRRSRPRSRSKSKPAVNGSREVLVSDDKEATDPTPRRKKKRKPSPSSPTQTASSKRISPLVREVTDTEEEVEVGLAAEISGMQDDVVLSETTTDVSTSTPYTQGQALRSQPTSKVFIEQKGGFKSKDKFKVAKQRAQMLAQKERDLDVEVTSTSPLVLALASQRVFKTFTLFCHGLFAGFAFWHITSVFMLNNVVTDSLEFLRIYQPMALPVQSLYYLLFVLCSVAAFDRYDIGRPTRRCMLRGVTIQSGAISVVVYFVSMVMSLSIAAIDDKIWLSKNQPDLWKDETTREAELNTWRILNTLRGAGAILGWFIISLKPTTDRLSKNLQSVDEDIMGDVVQMTVPPSGE